MTQWNIVTWIHLLAMAFFVGGQLAMAAVVVPVLRGEENRDKIRSAARKFGIGSAVAFAILLLSGSMMASHFQLWSDPALHAKLTLFVVMLALIGWHMKKPTWHWLEGVVFLISLVLVYLGVMLAH